MDEGCTILSATLDPSQGQIRLQGPPSSSPMLGCFFLAQLCVQRREMFTAYKGVSICLLLLSSFRLLLSDLQVFKLSLSITPSRSGRGPERAKTIETRRSSRAFLRGFADRSIPT